MKPNKRRMCIDRVDVSKRFKFTFDKRQVEDGGFITDPFGYNT